MVDLTGSASTLHAVVRHLVRVLLLAAAVALPSAGRASAQTVTPVPADQRTHVTPHLRQITTRLVDGNEVPVQVRCTTRDTVVSTCIAGVSLYVGSLSTPYVGFARADGCAVGKWCSVLVPITGKNTLRLVHHYGHYSFIADLQMGDSDVPRAGSEPPVQIPVRVTVGTGRRSVRQH